MIYERLNVSGKFNQNQSKLNDKNVDDLNKK